MQTNEDATKIKTQELNTPWKRRRMNFNNNDTIARAREAEGTYRVKNHSWFSILANIASGLLSVNTKRFSGA